MAVGLDMELRLWLKLVQTVGVIVNVRECVFVCLCVCSQRVSLAQSVRALLMNY